MGVFQLGKMTLSSMFGKPETLLYPAETKEPPQGLKGSIKLDPSTCILCGMCMRNCPCSAIRVDKATRTWSINHFMCIQCQYCARTCPKGSLTMLPHYTAPSTKIEEEVVSVPEQEKKAPNSE
ncbi:MAG: 4Fe-4S dicluster domain-containing protein [Eggerthellaceae bacterium]|nr:4Fe-4S dicluster domain-containing protein [Eggerthellaceae bacterium]